MRKLLIGVSAVLFAGAVYANCVTNTYTMDGRTVVCTTCCYQGNCNTTCF